MRRASSLRLSVFLILAGLVLQVQAQAPNKKIEFRVDRRIRSMTLEEKIGQLNQISPDHPNLEADVAAGKVGSVLSEADPEKIQRLQHLAIEKTRLHIPLLFGHDVIHGFRTIFPIPLALASSFDPSVIERMARVSANEASATGIRWTFSPMVDIARDPRWGRIAEGAGEDTYLQSQLAAAYVRGYQGGDLANARNLAACVKHFVGYGAAEAGRDYNSVDMSERKLREVYLPPFRAAIDAGAPTVMSSFNTLNGIPVTASPFILRQILRREWGFRGFVVSDYNAVLELIPHGVAATKEDAGQKAIEAGVDMDMSGQVYVNELAKLVNEKKIPVSVIDEAVRSILRVKFELGLFEHPYADVSKVSAEFLTKENRTVAREVAQKSIVLLKNDGDVLPLSGTIKSLAVIGPLADSKADMLGSWFADGKADDVVTVLGAMKARVGDKTHVLYSKGGEVTASSQQEIADAVATASQADAVLMVLGEKGTMSGEAASRASLDIPGDQQKLLQAIIATGKPVALIVMSGRPLILSWEAEHVPAILQTWFLGTEAGNAIADVVFGDVNPSGKLPVTFPRSIGQIPIYYNSLNTGRPLETETDKKYKSAYLDSPNTPLYPFGYGLSYTRFQYSELSVSGPDARGNIVARVEVKNVGQRAGDEIVQIYSRDLVSSVSRPVKELKAFRRVSLAPGESKQLEFMIPKKELAVWDSNMRQTINPGKYVFFVGSDSNATLEAVFNLEKSSIPGAINASDRRSEPKPTQAATPVVPASGSAAF